MIYMIKLYVLEICDLQIVQECWWRSAVGGGAIVLCGVCRTAYEGVKYREARYQRKYNSCVKMLLCYLETVPLGKGYERSRWIVNTSNEAKG